MNFTIEELSMNAWPSLKTLVYDGWIIRLADGYGNRANSICPVYPSKIVLEEKLLYCDELFMRHNLPVTYKLAGCEEHKTIEEKLEKLHYRKINETSLQTCELTGNFQNKSDGIILSDDFNDEWIDSVIGFNQIEEKHVPVFKKILANIAVEKFTVSKEVNGKIAGCGYGAIENNYVGVFDIIVKEELRGKGYGREIVEAILAEAAKRGVKNSYLQVMINNSAALNLYEKIGFKEIYRYWYRKKNIDLSN